MPLPVARGALHRERTQLENCVPCDLSTVREEVEIAADAKANGKDIRFGSLLKLRHANGSDHKGSIVFRADTVGDESGFYVVFTEQGASDIEFIESTFKETIESLD